MNSPCRLLFEPTGNRNRDVLTGVDVAVDGDAFDPIGEETASLSLLTAGKGAPALTNPSSVTPAPPAVAPLVIVPSIGLNLVLPTAAESSVITFVIAPPPPASNLSNSASRAFGLLGTVPTTYGRPFSVGAGFHPFDFLLGESRDGIERRVRMVGLES